MISGPLANKVGLGSGCGVEDGAGVGVDASVAVGCGGGEVSSGSAGSKISGAGVRAQAAIMKESPNAAVSRGMFLEFGIYQAQEYIAALPGPRGFFRLGNGLL